MLPIIFGIVALFGFACAHDERKEAPYAPSPPPPQPDPNDPCPNMNECACSEQSNGWKSFVDGEDSYVTIGSEKVDTAKQLYSSKNSLDSGYKVLTHIPREKFPFNSGSDTPKNLAEFGQQIQRMTNQLIKTNSSQYACFMSQHASDLAIYVTGHADRVGSDATNDALSAARAKTVASALKKSLEARRSELQNNVTIQYAGAGEARATFRNRQDEVSNEKDRTVEVKVGRLQDQKKNPAYFASREWQSLGTISVSGSPTPASSTTEEPWVMLYK